MTEIIRPRPARPLVVDAATPPAEVRVDSGRRIPAGGTTGQALIKGSNNDFAVSWGTATASAAWGAISGTLSNQTDLQLALAGKATAAQGALADSAVQPGGLAAIATSGSASDLGAGTLPAARFDDTAHGSRAGGALHANAIAGGAAGFMTGADKTKLDAISGTNTGDQTITLTGDVTGSGTGSFAATIAADTVTNAKLANVATATIKGRATAGTGDPEDLTGAQATALLDTFTSGAKGLVPASGGGTTNFLRADGTFAAPGGGGSPGGAAGELQYNSAGAFAGAADAEIEGGQLRLPYIATPTTPAAGGLKLYGMDFGPGAPAFRLPSGKVQLVQSDLGDFNINRFTPAMGSASLVLETSLALTAIGTAGLANGGSTNLHVKMPRTDFLVGTASTSAIAGWRHTGTGARGLTVGRDANAPGGFLARTLWSPATGVAILTHRGFAGLCDWGNTAPTDVQPSLRVNIIGMGWDAADANIQFMHNDGAGTATKIDLGASFPVPTTDRAAVYELQLYSPNDLTQSVSYRVIRYNTTDKTIAAEATGTVITNLPAVTTLLGVGGAMSVGGTSSIIAVALMGILVAREY